MVEPGELIFPGPLRQDTLKALQTVNETFPRFPVGGSGDGDTVPMTVPKGSFVLNRRAAKMVQGEGYQGGGSVGQGVPQVIINLTIPVTIQTTLGNQLDIDQAADQLARKTERILIARLGQRRFFGRD